MLSFIALSSKVANITETLHKQCSFFHLGFYICVCILKLCSNGLLAEYVMLNTCQYVVIWLCATKISRAVRDCSTS